MTTHLLTFHECLSSNCSTVPEPQRIKPHESTVSFAFDGEPRHALAAVLKYVELHHRQYPSTHLTLQLINCVPLGEWLPHALLQVVNVIILSFEDLDRREREMNEAQVAQVRAWQCD